MNEFTGSVRYAFLHIPKTAGTSFLHAIRTVFPQTSLPFAATYMTDSAAAQLQHFDVVAGHLSFDDYRKYFPKYRSLTILRDPVQRCLSWYWYAREVTPDSVTTEEVRSAKNMDAEDFFGLDADIIRRNIVNRQMRQLGAHALNFTCNEAATLACAKKNLADMAWIGDVDNMAADLAVLRSIPGFGQFPALPRLNAGRRRDGITPRLRSRIEQLNWADMELYEYYRANQKGNCT